MVKKALFIVGLLIFAGLLAYGLTYFENKTRAPERILVISYQRSGGFAGVDDRWSIYSDGYVEYRDFFGTAGTRNVEAQAVADLLELIKKEGFFSFEERYGFPSNCRDCFSYRVAVRLPHPRCPDPDAMWKTVMATDGADAPSGLWRIIGELNTLVYPFLRLRQP